MGPQGTRLLHQCVPALLTALYCCRQGIIPAGLGALLHYLLEYMVVVVALDSVMVTGFGDNPLHQCCFAAP